MIYFLIFISMLFFTYFYRNNMEKSNRCFIIFFAILWILLSFRYGQGTDYFAYKQLMLNVDSVSDVIFNSNQIHSEVGFRFLYWVFGNNFELFIFVISSFEMIMLYIFINRYSVNKLFSLTLFFPIYYLVYYFSTIRQGFAISCFIGLLFPLLMKKDYKKYYMGILITSLFHSSSLVLILIPFISKLNLRKMIVLLFFSFAFGGILCLFFNFFPHAIFEKVAYYWQGKISVLSLIHRIVLFLIIFMYLLINKEALNELKEKNKKYFEQEMKILLIGLMCYFVMMGSPLIASRLMGYFEVFEIIIFPKLLNLMDVDLGKFKRKICILLEVSLVLIISFNCFKTIKTNLSQGNYKDNVNVLTYPYVSIFNKDKLWDYKNIDIYSKNEIVTE